MKSHLPLLILDLAKVLGVAALTTLLFRRLKQPAVLGYLLAGLIVGPHVPVPLVADLTNVQTLAELGVILLMFSVGLEFDFRKLAREGVPAVLLGLVQVGLTTWLGFLAGRVLGWGLQESTLMGAALGVSSTMIIAKLFEEHGARGPLRELVLSVLVVQDLYAILLLAGLDTSSAAAGGVGWALARVGLFLAGLLGIGGLLLPPLLRWAADHGRDETLLVAAVGACFTCAVLADLAGCSPALGAFGAGMLASASRRVRPIERLVLPLRDMFGAIFFVAVGMLLDPHQLARQTGPILGFSAVVLLGSALGGSLGGVLAGLPLRLGFRVGLTLAQPGELSLVLIGVGSAGLALPHALPVVVGVTFVTAILGPWSFRRGEALASALKGGLPVALTQRLASIQGWTGRLGRRPGTPASLGQALAAPVAYLLVDALLFNVLLLAAAHFRTHPLLAHQPGATLALMGAAMAALAFLGWALFRRAGEIAGLLVEDRNDGQGRGPLLRLVTLLVVATPSFAYLQPLLPRGPALALSIGVLVCLLILTRIPERPFPGSEWLFKRVQRPWAAVPPPEAPQALATLQLEPACPFAGRPLGDLELAMEEVPDLALVAVRRHGQWLGSAPLLRLQPGDEIAVAASPAGLEALERLIRVERT